MLKCLLKTELYLDVNLAITCKGLANFYLYYASVVLILSIF